MMGYAISLLHQLTADSMDWMQPRYSDQLLLALRQVTSYTNPNLIPPGLWDFVSRSWQAYTVGLSIDPAPDRC